MSGGSKGGVQVYQGVKRDVRGVRGSVGMPGVSWGVKGGVQVSQGFKRGVKGVPGVKVGLRDQRGIRGALRV